VTRDRFCDGLGFPEGPRWRDGSLWISDIAAREVLRFDGAGNVVERLPTPGRPSGLGWLPDGRLLVVVMEERAVLRRDGDGWRTHADLSQLTSAPVNDMVVSAAGDAYVTGLGYVDGEERRPTRVILVRPDGSAEPQAGDLWRPNGCVITPDGERFVVAEARVHRLTGFRIDADGSLRDPQEFALLPSGTWADGICLDAEGAIWVGDPKGRACRRVASDGTVVAEIDTSPVPCIACTLGGDDGRTLFLLLCDLGDFDELAGLRGGRIETVRVDVPGAGSP
jgi:sugar lactone lactonase YvrE